MKRYDSFEKLKIANERYLKEHQRWYQWALLFFGSYVSIFALWKYFINFIPIQAPIIICIILSILWIFVSLGMRRTHLTWLKIIKKIELDPYVDYKLSILFENLEKEHDVFKDFRESINFLICSENPFLRVTRVLVFFGFLLTIIFTLLLFATCFHNMESKLKKSLKEVRSKVSNNTILIKSLKRDIHSIEKNMKFIMYPNIQNSNKSNKRKKEVTQTKN